MLLVTSACVYKQIGCHLPLCSDWPNTYYGGCTSYINLEYLQYLLHPPSSNKDYPYTIMTIYELYFMLCYSYPKQDDTIKLHLYIYTDYTNLLIYIGPTE